MGGHLAVTFQPWEFVIIVGVALGTFIIANSLATIKDTGAAIIEAILDKGTTQRDYLDVLGVLYTLMRELRGKARSEVEQHVDNPGESAIFKNFPKVLADANLTSFICDYCRLIIKPHSMGAPVKGYALRFTRKGAIVVDGPKGSYAAAPGVVLPDRGRILSIQNRNGRWVVLTENGTITEPAPRGFERPPPRGKRFRRD
jgi:hypothetical protein